VSLPFASLKAKAKSEGLIDGYVIENVEIHVLVYSNGWVTYLYRFGVAITTTMAQTWQ